MRYLTECRQVYRQFREKYHTTGSILPSSLALARAMTRPMRRERGVRRILAVGPGTGAVTAAIARLLRPGGRFDIVEINAEFVDYLNRRFADEPAFRKQRERTTILHRPLQDVAGEGEYDFIDRKSTRLN